MRILSGRCQTIFKSLTGRILRGYSHLRVKILPFPMRGRTMKTLRTAMLMGVLAAISGSVFAQKPGNAAITRGFDYEVPAYATGEERQAQDNLWVMSLRFKSIRMMEMQVTDPKTKQPRTDLIYYLVYEATNREIERNAEDVQTTPANDFDAPPGPELFVPEITLVVEDEVTDANTQSRFPHELQDEVIPEAQRRIQVREKTKLINTVQAVGSVPAIVKKDDPNPSSFNGVAMFRNVDPEMDYFRLVLSGFSNGYKLVKGPVSYDDLKTLAANDDLKVNDQIWNGDLESDWRAAAEVGDLFDAKKSPPPNADASQWYYSVSPDRGDATSRVWRKTLVQHYWRPGDGVDQNEREIRRKGEARWIYVPDDSAAVAETPATAKFDRKQRDEIKAARLAILTKSFRPQQKAKP